jgi:predicted O-methyltransferase YrrM
MNVHMDKQEYVLAELRLLAMEQAVPILKPEAEQLLLALAREKRPRRILEVGTAIGYSTLLLATTLPEDGELISLELDPARAILAEQTMVKVGKSHQVAVVIGDAQMTIPRLEGKFDFVFLDGPKGQYLAYLKLLLDKLAPGAVVVADNVLFRGLVASLAEPPRRYRTIVNRLREYLEFVTTDQRFATTLMSDGDGVAISNYQGIQGDDHEKT